MELISQITGKNGEKSEKMVARVLCQGDNTKVTKVYEFESEKPKLVQMQIFILVEIKVVCILFRLW